jgi:hypothetical protein
VPAAGIGYACELAKNQDLGRISLDPVSSAFIWSPPRQIFLKRKVQISFTDVTSQTTSAAVNAAAAAAAAANAAADASAVAVDDDDDDDDDVRPKKIYRKTPCPSPAQSEDCLNTSFPIVNITNDPFITDTVDINTPIPVDTKEDGEITDDDDDNNNNNNNNNNDEDDDRSTICYSPGLNCCYNCMARLL